MKTPFDDMFDFNHDGNLDWLEKGARDAFIIQMHEDNEQTNNQPDEDWYGDVKTD